MANISAKFDPDTSKMLDEICEVLQIDKSEALRRATTQLWQALQIGRPFVERAGGPPQYLLSSGNAKASTRSSRKAAINLYLEEKVNKRRHKTLRVSEDENPHYGGPIPQVALIDSGPIIAYFDRSDDWHDRCSRLIETYTGQFITTEPVITEVMWLLRADCRAQNEFILLAAQGVFRNECLTSEDFSRIAELNSKYSDIPADYCDLSLIAIAERLSISSVFSLDREFDIYRMKLGARIVPLRRIRPD